MPFPSWAKLELRVGGINISPHGKTSEHGFNLDQGDSSEIHECFFSKTSSQ